MRVRARVDDGRRRPLLAGAVDAADQLALAVALETFDADAEGCAERGDVPLDVGQRGMPVNLRLARAEQIEIGAVEQQDVFHGCFPCNRWFQTAFSTQRPSPPVRG